MSSLFHSLFTTFRKLWDLNDIYTRSSKRLSRNVLSNPQESSWKMFLWNGSSS